MSPPPVTDRMVPRTYPRVPRGLLVGTAAVLALTWGLFALDPHAWPGIISPVAQSAAYLALCVLTVFNRRAKILLVRTFQRYTVNPLMRALLAVGVNPLGLAILETRGRVSGRALRTPVGNGRSGSTLWIIAEHGLRAGYVRNLAADPRVRVRLRVGWRYRWVTGTAEILPADDPLARQRRIIRWHPLRALNAINVRTLGADLLTVRVDLDLDSSDWRHPGPRIRDREPLGTQQAERGSPAATTLELRPTAGAPATGPASASPGSGTAITAARPATALASA